MWPLTIRQFNCEALNALHAARLAAMEGVQSCQTIKQRPPRKKPPRWIGPQLRAMTIGELFNLLDTDNLEDRRRVDKILYQTLCEAGSLYDDCWNCDIQCDALRFAAEALNEDGVDETTATLMAHLMAALAHYMLQAEGAKEWDAPTVTALKKIRASNR
jgi:hypothetical protein